MPSIDPVTALAAATHGLLAGRTEPALAPFLAAWPAPPLRRPVSAVSLPVVQWLAALPPPPVRAVASPADSAPAGSAVLAALRAAAPMLAWLQTYPAGSLPAHFLANYGWSELIGTRGPLPSESFAAGFLLLGPHTFYPTHSHEARELYVPIVGEADWQQGDGIWRTRTAGALIVHESGEPHAMRTAEQPVVALYLWRSADLAQSARLAPVV